MNDEQIRKRANEILHMSNEEFIRDCTARRKKRQLAFDAVKQKWYGSTFGKEFRSVDDVFKGLDAENPKLRMLALWAVLGPWSESVGHNADSHIQEMALADPDDNVRSTALIVLGALFSGSCDKQICSVLAKVTKNDAEHYECRQSAYSGLLDVLGSRSTDLLPFPECVDWDLIDKLSR